MWPQTHRTQWIWHAVSLQRPLQDRPCFRHFTTLLDWCLPLVAVWGSLQHSSGSILIILIIFIIFPSVSFSPQIFIVFLFGSELLRLSDSRVSVFICTNKSRQIKICVKNRLKQSSSPFCCWFCWKPAVWTGVQVTCVHLVCIFMYLLCIYLFIFVSVWFLLCTCSCYAFISACC